MNRFEIKVKKDKLLKILQINRDKHENDTKKAMAAFRVAVQSLLKKRLEDIEKLVIEPHGYLRFDIHCPPSHLDEYNRVISMLMLSADEHINITDEQYRSWVEDNWAWKPHWQAVSGAYIRAYDKGVGSYDA